MSTAVVPAEIARALEELEQAFPGRVSTEAHEPAGTIVRIRGLELTGRWSAPSAELWFAIPFHYPDAPIYPYYVVGATPTAGVAGLQSVSWRGMAIIQVSLRHTNWDPTCDTAVGSVLQTQAWLRAS